MHTGQRAGVAQFVAFKRHEKGFSARSTSLAAGQSESYVTKVEAETIEPSLKAFSRLAMVLGFTPAEVWAVVCCEAARP